MSQKQHPKGGRPAKNFEPRYGQKTRTAGGASPKHRGYRPAEDDGGAPKRRFNDAQRSGRDEARAISNHARSNQRSAPFERNTDSNRDGSRYSGSGHRDSRPRYEERSPERSSGRGDNRYAAPNTRGYGRDDRNTRRDDRPYSRDDRSDRGYGRNDRQDRGTRGFDRNDRPSYGRDDRRDNRGGYGADNRGFRGDDRRGGYSRDDRQSRDNRQGRDDRGGYTQNRDDRGGYRRDDRGGFDRGANRSAGRPFGRDDQRGARGFDRDDRRPARDDRGGYSRDDRGGFDRGGQRAGAQRFERTDRPRFDRGDRNDRPRFDRDERRSYSDRPRHSERPTRDSAPRREDRPSRDNWARDTTSAPKSAEFNANADVVHERLEAQTVAAEEVSNVTFGDLGLGSNITEILTGMGAEKPFPIQAASIPSVLAGRDVLGRGRTGSGKTIAFGAPLVESILTSQKGKKREYGRAPRAIILAPTRELALQIDRTVQPIARSVGLFTTQIYGGVPQARQVGALKKGVDIIVGTPGRIEDLINQGKLDLSEVRIAVLDEADHMCELGFVEPVQRILRHTGTALPNGEKSQKLLFSATLDREVAALVNEFLIDPAVFEVAGEDQNSGTIDHRVLVVEHRDKADILSSLVDRDGKTLVFSRTRAYAEMLTEQFEDAGIPAVALHGDLNQAKRTRNLHKLTSGKVQVLVATDVAARGIHVDDVDLVVQADAPDEYKTYLHRAGRTGRAGRSGTVVTLITRPRRRRLGELLTRAEIDAPFVDARPGDDILEELTGRAPSEAELTA